MKKIKKAGKPFVAAGIVFTLFSYNNYSQEKAPVKPFESTQTPTSMKITPAPAVAPFDVMEISHAVKNYAAWRPAFDTDSINRKASGLENITVGRGIDNPNNILIVLKASDAQKGKDFAANPKLKEVMENAGVISKPDIQFFRVIRFNPASNEKQWVVVTHRVKNFDAWVKGYDGEGKEKRASEGMIDVALARGVDDPNLIQIVFDITDLAKAKAAIFSEEKKTLMLRVGVESVPKIEFYSTAE